MWFPPDFPGSTRAEIHIYGPNDNTNQFLHNLITEIEEPFDYQEEPDGFLLIYTSPEKAKKAHNSLYEKLCGLYPDLIGASEGVYLNDENDVLFFKDCEVSRNYL